MPQTDTSDDELRMGVYGLYSPKASLGADSSTKLRYSDILAGDGDGAIPPILRQSPVPASGSVPISFDRYVSPDVAARETERIWRKAWQVACREEDIRQAGDRIRYDVGTLSFMIVRDDAGLVRAFYNSCRHRGRPLCDGKGSAAKIRCHFHAWTWNLDGTLEWVPGHEDFPHVDGSRYGLPEVQAACWGGNVFINPDPNAPPLREALGILPDLFADNPTDERYTVLHFRKKLRCNWKLAQEAFMESYHVLETHWDGMPFFGSAYCQYNAFESEHATVNWLTAPSLVPDFWIADRISPMEGLRQYCTAFGVALPAEGTVRTYTEARQYLAGVRAKAMSGAAGRDFTGLSVGQLIDMTKAFVYPNFHPWWGEGLPWWYRFLPLGDDPATSMMEVRITAPVPSAATPPSAEAIEIDFDQPCGDVVGVGGRIIDQDVANLVELQKGMAFAMPGLDFATLARYQECNIQQFHRRYNEIMIGNV